MRFGSATVGNDVGPWRTTHSRDSLGSRKTTSRASSVNGESTWKISRVSRLQARSISETASVITGSLRRPPRPIHSRLGHSFENLLIAGATTTAGRSSANPMSMSVVLGERNKCMEGMSVSVASTHSNSLTLGNQGSLAVWSCTASRISEVTGPHGDPPRSPASFKHIFENEPILLSLGFS